MRLVAKKRGGRVVTAKYCKEAIKPRRRVVTVLCAKGGERGAREQLRPEDYGSARTVAAPGTPRADSRASKGSTVAAPGTP